MPADVTTHSSVACEEQPGYWHVADRCVAVRCFGVWESLTDACWPFVNREKGAVIQQRGVHGVISDGRDERRRRRAVPSSPASGG